uniref:Uncharacterized protein n=1 Tax=Salix viminalis TaxID=40686 RepID=A0A6N2JYP5_SALVM
MPSIELYLVLSDSSDRIAKRVLEFVVEGGEGRSKKLPVSNLRVFVAVVEEGGVINRYAEYISGLYQVAGNALLGYHVSKQ